MISRSPFAYSSMIRRSSCECESLAFGTFLPGSWRSVVFTAHGSRENQRGHYAKSKGKAALLSFVFDNYRQGLKLICQCCPTA
jgi:hypothetical protein